VVARGDTKEYPPIQSIKSKSYCLITISRSKINTTQAYVKMYLACRIRWSNSASLCAEKVPCDCEEGKIDVQITRAKGAPYFLVTEDSASTIFSKKTCREIGEIHTISRSACIDGGMVLLSTKNHSGKTKVFVKNAPGDIMKALKNHRPGSQ